VPIKTVNPAVIIIQVRTTSMSSNILNQIEISTGLEGLCL